MAFGKVLVVDDSATQRQIIRELLEDNGFQVEEAKDGLEGLAKGKNGIFDVIVSDISMPLMDGLEMIRQLKEDENTKYIPIICASATFQDLATKLKALIEVGAEEYFYATQEKEELLAKVLVMMRIRRVYLDLLEKNKQLKLFNDASVGRELKMIELKDQIKGLEAELAKYKK